VRELWGLFSLISTSPLRFRHWLRFPASQPSISVCSVSGPAIAAQDGIASYLDLIRTDECHGRLELSILRAKSSPHCRVCQQTILCVIQRRLILLSRQDGVSESVSNVVALSCILVCSLCRLNAPVACGLTSHQTSWQTACSVSPDQVLTSKL